MISDELKEAWRAAARRHLENSEVIKKMHQQSAPTLIGTRTRRQKPSTSLENKPINIPPNRFFRKITNLNKQYDFSNADILGANLTQKSKEAFVQRLHKDSKPDAGYPNNIILKALLLGLRDVQNSFN